MSNSGRFAIDALSGVVTVADADALLAPDAALASGYAIRVRASDAAGNDHDAELSITVWNANTAPLIIGVFNVVGPEPDWLAR